MTAEREYMLRCLSDFCNGKMTQDLPKELDPAMLYQIAENHSLDGILYYQSESLKMAEARFRESLLSHVFLSVNRRDILNEIVSRFHKEGIDLICMKGSVFRDYYPVPELRSMGDIDIIIKPKDREKTDRIMADIGFEHFIDNHSVWTYWIWKFRVEIHDHMFYENLANRIDYRSYFDRIWDHCHRAPVFGIESENLFVPDEEFHFLYLMAHTAKHIINSGSGFRAYLDMALMNKICTEMDWNRVRRELEHLELLDFTKSCMSLCEAWFDTEMPLSDKKTNQLFIDEITAKTFEDGAFGYSNENNRSANAAKLLKRFHGPYIIGAVKRILRILFPSYDNLQLNSRYSFVDGRPWLVPAAWIYRWVYCILRKRKHSVELLTELFVKKKDIIQRQEYLAKWGL